MRRLRVGIVGLGGTGSVVGVQLAHLGVGSIVAIDGDLVEASNVSRIVGARTADIGRAHKVDVFERYARELGLPVDVRVCRSFATSEAELRLLRGCDAIFICVDKHTPRSLINRLAYDALIPAIDLGTGFRVDGDGRLVGDSGRVVVVGPGRPCLACWGHIDPNALRIEALTDADRRREADDGYIDGADVPQPSVIPFSTMVAGAAVIELLRIVAGFGRGEAAPNRMAFAFTEASVRRNALLGDARCRVCSGR